MKSWYKIAMANKWIPSIYSPETQLDFIFDCTSASESQMEIMQLMDNNNDWQPNLKTRRYLENFTGAMKDDYAMRFKYCIYEGEPYIAAYFSAIHYVFKVKS